MSNLSNRALGFLHVCVYVCERYESEMSSAPTFIIQIRGSDYLLHFSLRSSKSTLYVRFRERGVTSARDSEGSIMFFLCHLYEGDNEGGVAMPLWLCRWRRGLYALQFIVREMWLLTH